MTTQKLSLNDVFLVPLSEDCHAVGAIWALSKPRRGLALACFSGPLSGESSSLEALEKMSSTNQLPHVLLFGDVRLRSGEWPILGVVPRWRPADLEIPTFNIDVRVNGIRNEEFYSRELSLQRMRVRSKDDQRELPNGGIHNCGSVVAYLKRRSAQSEQASNSIEVAADLAASSNPLDDDASRDYLEDVFAHADHPVSLLRDTFDRMLRSEFVDVGQGYATYSAASIVAYVSEGQPADVSVSEAVTQAMRSLPLDAVNDLRHLASQATTQLLGDHSELMSVWLTEADKAEWIEQATALAMRLRSGGGRRHT